MSCSPSRRRSLSRDGLVQVESQTCSRKPRSHPSQRPAPTAPISVTMSSTLVTGSSSQLTDTKFSDVIPSVAVIDTPLSKSIALLRPGLILGLLALRFNSLVADPVPTLQLALPAVALVQTVYAIICLPVAGSQSAKVVRKPRPGEKKKADINGPNTISVCTMNGAFFSP